MRIVIETEEWVSASSTLSSTQSATYNLNPGTSDTGAPPVKNAGPPSVALIQAISDATAVEPVQAVYRDGMDGGGPSLDLVKAVQSAPSPGAAGAADSTSDGGAAPSA
jgi:hypothetical protein